jgi:hypothetical protein
MNPLLKMQLTVSLLSIFMIVSAAWAFKSDDVVLSDWVNMDDYQCIASSSSISGAQDFQYHINGISFLNFLSHLYGDPDVTWDLNSDNSVDVIDLLAVLGGYGNPIQYDPVELDFSNFVYNVTFGEGNNMFDPVYDSINGQPIAFTFYKTTPYDEDDVFIQENPNSFRLDVVTTTESYIYIFILNNYP